MGMSLSYAAGRRTLFCALVVVCAAAATPHRVAARHGQDKGDAGRSVSTSGQFRRLVEVVPPKPGDGGAAGAIDFEGIGQQSTTIIARQRLVVMFVDGVATVSFRYSSGLRLTAVLRSADREIVLPRSATAKVLVRDSYGVGVAEAHVEAQGGEGRVTWRSTARTAPGGLADVATPVGMPARALSVSAEGFAPAVRRAALSTDAETLVTIEAGATITGTVRRQAGAPGDVLLRLWDVTNTRRRVVQLSVRSEFTVGGLAAGEYEVELVVPRAGARVLENLHAEAGQVIDLGSIGLVPEATVRGTVKDLQGRPLAGARLTLYRSNPSEETPPEVHTDEAGKYVFAALLPGEYRTEIFLPGVGWRTYPFEEVVAVAGEAVERSFVFGSSGCSLVVVFVPDEGGLAANYSIELPVTDPPTEVRVGASTVERVFASVPCEGGARVRRLDGEREQFFTSLEPGEARLIVPVTARATTALQVVAGNRPIVGAALWVEVRDSSGIVEKAAGVNVTDATGQALLSIPRGKSLTLYMQAGRNLSIVYDARPQPSDGVMRLALPSRALSGVVSDARGAPLSGLAVSAQVAREGARDSLGFPASAVTTFKGVTDQDGRFLIRGVAQGTWSVSINGKVGERVVRHQVAVEILASERGEKQLKMGPSAVK